MTKESTTAAGAPAETRPTQGRQTDGEGNAGLSVLFGKGFTTFAWGVAQSRNPPL